MFNLRGWRLLPKLTTALLGVALCSVVHASQFRLVFDESAGDAVSVRFQCTGASLGCTNQAEWVDWVPVVPGEPSLLSISSAGFEVATVSFLLSAFPTLGFVDPAFGLLGVAYYLSESPERPNEVSDIFYISRQLGDNPALGRISFVSDADDLGGLVLDSNFAPVHVGLASGTFQNMVTGTVVDENRFPSPFSVVVRSEAPEPGSLILVALALSAAAVTVRQRR